MKKEKLFEQFPPVSTQEWIDKINSDLKGADFNRKMIWKTNEGIDVKPFYRLEDVEKLMYTDTLPGEYPYIRGTKANDNSWRIRQNIEVSDYISANKKALSLLMKGVDSIGFNFSDPESLSERNLDILLGDIHLESIETNFRSAGKAKELLGIFITIAGKRGLDPDSIKGGIEADPLGRLMLNGTLCVPVEAGLDYLAELTSASSALPLFRTIHPGGHNFSNSGANIVQELAFTVSMGAEYLVQMTSRGLDAAFAASKIRFSFGTGSDYFPEIARLRAARLLWSAVTRRFLPDDKEGSRMDIHCVTTRWNKTLFDPYVNMLRTQTEAMSAVIGGADSLTVEAFDINFRQPDEFSERIARNQQLLLKEEAYFDKVADPSAGSYYIENLTQLIADEAWRLFIKIEEAGGFIEALRAGLIQKMILEAAARRRSDVASRKVTLLGTNQYPDPKESPFLSYNPEGFSLPENNKNEKEVEQITLFRGSEEYERIRLAVSRAARKPVAFLFPVGDPGMRRARAQFSAGFFGCAGYRIIDNTGFETVRGGIQAFRGAGADILVICRSDEEYPAFAPEILAQVRDKAIVVVAGNPASADQLRAQGIEHFIHLRTNVTEALALFNDRLGIKM